METNREGAKYAKEEERRMRQLGDEPEQLAYAVIGAAIEVHRVLGPGFLEEVYHKALKLEFIMRGIPHKSKHPVAVEYKGHPVGEGQLDFLVGDVVVVELKAVQSLAPIHEAQVLSYLKMTKHTLGLLINFNVPILKQGIKRIILSSYSSS
ncbi:GxxExxY protein [Nostoc sp. NMS4]|uniref:GxxExxY protein n=1 Tax=Nostoc sp. NMS4 TaxID=2815390 RepID=UPI0025FCB6D9|nr:GxxExxY protein [Nostoc sp. NMS4]MBN3927480.1 GxxExxY protein [Nostoc sp. NMS4]